MMCLTVAAAVIAMLSSAAQAQSHQHQPYAGLQSRSIKAMSEQQVADLRDGKGMSLALAAELNGYPGPSHVLELKEPLNLTDRQLQSIEGMFTSMQKEARAIGARLIMQETHLDAMFANHDIDTFKLAHMTKAIGETQAQLREAHLKYHLTTTELLTPEQTKRYAELRGYAPKQ
jgi:Spy/CpxP family protein refolding chaperone